MRKKEMRIMAIAAILAGSLCMTELLIEPEEYFPFFIMRSVSLPVASIGRSSRKYYGLHHLNLRDKKNQLIDPQECIDVSKIKSDEERLLSALEILMFETRLYELGIYIQDSLRKLCVYNRDKKFHVIAALPKGGTAYGSHRHGRFLDHSPQGFPLIIDVYTQIISLYRHELLSLIIPSPLYTRRSMLFILPSQEPPTFLPHFDQVAIERLSTPLHPAYLVREVLDLLKTAEYGAHSFPEYEERISYFLRHDGSNKRPYSTLPVSPIQQITASELSTPPTTKKIDSKKPLYHVRSYRMPHRLGRTIKARKLDGKLDKMKHIPQEHKESTLINIPSGLLRQSKSFITLSPYGMDVDKIASNGSTGPWYLKYRKRMLKICREAIEIFDCESDDFNWFCGLTQGESITDLKEGVDRVFRNFAEKNRKQCVEGPPAQVLTDNFSFICDENFGSVRIKNFIGFHVGYRDAFGNDEDETPIVLKHLGDLFEVYWEYFTYMDSLTYHRNGLVAAETNAATIEKVTKWLQNRHKLAPQFLLEQGRVKITGINEIDLNAAMKEISEQYDKYLGLQSAFIKKIEGLQGTRLLLLSTFLKSSKRLDLPKIPFPILLYVAESFKKFTTRGPFRDEIKTEAITNHIISNVAIIKIYYEDVLTKKEMDPLFIVRLRDLYNDLIEQLWPLLAKLQVHLGDQVNFVEEIFFPYIFHIHDRKHSFVDFPKLLNLANDFVHSGLPLAPLSDNQILEREKFVLHMNILITAIAGGPHRDNRY